MPLSFPTELLSLWDMIVTGLRCSTELLSLRDIGMKGDSAAPDVAGGMVHIALAVHAAADSLSQNPNSCAAAFLSWRARTIPQNAEALSGISKTTLIPTHLLFPVP